MSATNSAVSSLATQLRRSASNLSDLVLSRNLGYDSTRLAFDDDHATRVASSAQSFADSVNASPSSRVRRFLDRLSTRGSSNDSLQLRSEHRNLLRTGAAGEVLTDLTRDGQFERVDMLHGYLNSVLDRNSTESQDSRLVRALRSNAPPSYSSNDSASPPPMYTSPLRTISTGSTVPLSTQSRISSPYELDSAIGNMNWSHRSTPRSDSHAWSAAELEASPVSIYEMDASAPGSALRRWAEPEGIQTSLARSVVANSSSPSSHPASRYFSSLGRTPYIGASSQSGISKASRFEWKKWKSLARRLSRSRSSQPTRSARSSAVELDGRPVRPAKSRSSFAPHTTFYPSSVKRYHTSRTTSNRSIPTPLRIGQAPTLSFANSQPSAMSSDWIPAPLRIGQPVSLTSNRSVPLRTASTLARSINSLASQTPSYNLLRQHAEFARSQARPRQAISSALASDALSRLHSSLLDYLASASRANRNTNQRFEERSAFQATSNSLAEGSIPQFYRAAGILDEGRNQGGREVDIDEIDELITGLQEYRDRLQGYQESSLAV